MLGQDPSEGYLTSSMAKAFGYFLELVNQNQVLGEVLGGETVEHATAVGGFKVIYGTQSEAVQYLG